MMTKRCTLFEANERVAALLRRIKGGHNRSVGCWKAGPEQFRASSLLLLSPSLSLEWTERASRARGQMQKRSDYNSVACISANFLISQCLPKNLSAFFPSLLLSSKGWKFYLKVTDDSFCCLNLIAQIPNPNTGITEAIWGIGGDHRYRAQNSKRNKILLRSNPY